MKQDTHSNTALFLMELIMVIGFFSLVSTVCMQLFAGASRTSTQSVRLNHAVRAAESLTEAWIATDGDLEELSRLYPGSTVRPDSSDSRTGTLVLCFDTDWKKLADDADHTEYTVTLDSHTEDAAVLYGREAAGGLAVIATVTATASDGTVICTLTPDHYVGGAP